MGTRRSRRSWADTVHLGQRIAARSNGPLLGACASSGRAARHSKKEARPLGGRPLPRVLLERAASKVADSTASEPPGLSPTRTH